MTAETRDLEDFSHITAMADYALQMRKQLEYVNEHSFNNFKIRIGEGRKILLFSMVTFYLILKKNIISFGFGKSYRF